MEGNNTKMITNIKVVSLLPVVDKKYKSLVQTNVKPEKLSFELESTKEIKICASVANAIRRTGCSELLVKYLHVDVRDIATSDEFHIHEQIRNRLACIPIMQNVPVGTSFSVKEANTSGKMTSVYSNFEFDGKPICNKFNIATLHANKSIYINNITVKEQYGTKFGPCVLASHAISRDNRPDKYDEFTNTGVRSRETDSEKLELIFDIHGTVDSRTFIKLICDNLIERIKNAEEQIGNIYFAGDIYQLRIFNESESLMVMFADVTRQLFPELLAVKSLVDDTDVNKHGTLTIRSETNDVKSKLTIVTQHLQLIFKTIKGYF